MSAIEARLLAPHEREVVLEHLAKDARANLLLIDLVAKLGQPPAAGEMRSQVAIATRGGDLCGVVALRPTVVFDAGTETFHRVIESGQLIILHLGQMAAAWKSSVAWPLAKLALAQQKEIRGPAAYVWGHRYERQRALAAAADCFRTAVADSTPDSPLARLAGQALKRVSASR